MRIINLVDSLHPTNRGIWQAAIATAPTLKNKYGVAIEIWFPVSDIGTTYNLEELAGARPVELTSTSKALLKKLGKERRLNKIDDIIISHGCWRYPTRWGAALKKEGFSWIATPHGMLEPWSLSQKAVQKNVYFSLLEGPLMKKADVVRAVSKPEEDNIKRWFTRTSHLPNSIEPLEYYPNKNQGPITFLFLGRLHAKKGVVPLAEAWMDSRLSKEEGFKLIIAGPNEGEKEKLIQVLSKSKVSNPFELSNAIYGRSKKKLLEAAHFFVLPSHSEGFASSVIEAMSFGAIPIITKGCNFPEAFEENLGIKTSPHQEAIKEALETAASLSKEEERRRSYECWHYVNKNFSHERLAAAQMELYRRLIKE